MRMVEKHKVWLMCAFGIDLKPLNLIFPAIFQRKIHHLIHRSYTLGLKSMSNPLSTSLTLTPF